MALAFKKGSFTSNSGTAPFDQAVTGVGLGVAGKAIIFWWTEQTAEGTAAGQILGIGFAVSASAEGAMVTANQDNVTTTNSERRFANNRCILLEDVTATTGTPAEFKSFDGSDGDFTITWISDPGAGRIVHFVVLGGSDITAQHVAEINLNASTGDQAYAHGLGATPDFAIWASINNTSASAVHSTLAIGWAVQGTASTRKCGSVSINASDGETMEANQDQMRVFATDRPLICMGNSVPTVDIELDYPTTGNLFDGTNVTFNQVNAATLNTDLLCLFLAGGQYDAGSFAARDNNGDDSFTVAFPPKGLFFGRAPQASASTATAGAYMAIGAGDMAFPRVAATNGGNSGGATTSHTINLPAGIVSGNLLLVLFSGATPGTTTWPGGWTEFSTASTGTPSFSAGYRRADGTEGGSITITTASSVRSAHLSYKIVGHHGTTNPEQGSINNTKDPSSFSPSWGAKNTLWLPMLVYADGTVAVTGYPTNYSDGINFRENDAAGVGVGSARRELNTATEDAGTFTVAATGISKTAMVAVPPGVEGSIAVSSTDAIEPTQADQRTLTTKVIVGIAANGADDGEADLTAMGTTSTINWTSPPFSTNTVLWWAAGDNAAAGPALPIGWFPMLGVGR